MWDDYQLLAFGAEADTILTAWRDGRCFVWHKRLPTLRAVAFVIDESAKVSDFDPPNDARWLEATARQKADLRRRGHRWRTG